MGKASNQSNHMNRKEGITMLARFPHDVNVLVAPEIRTPEAAAVVRETRREMRALSDALIATYNETRDAGPRATVAALIDALGYDAAAVAVAEMISASSVHDGRIDDRNRAWAASIPGVPSHDAMQAAGFYGPDAIHPCHRDAIADAMRRAERPAPAPAPEMIPGNGTPAQDAETAPDAVETAETAQGVETPAETAQAAQDAPETVAGMMPSPETVAAAYNGRPESTRFSAVYKRGTWRVTDIYRHYTRRASQTVKVYTMPEAAKEALIARYSTFSRSEF